MKTIQKKPFFKLIPLIIGVFTLLFSNSQTVYAQKDGEEVIIGKYRKIYSKVLNEERRIIIHLPAGYEESEERYPVLYKLDGDFIPSFARATATVDILALEGKIPSMIVVAVCNTDRGRDMFPVKVKPRPTSGGANFFLKFLTKELIPFIERNYSTNKYRILMGESNSALFVVFAFLEQPESFNSYIASSPMLGWCNDYILNKTDILFQKKKSLNRFLYIIYGGKDLRFVTNSVPGYKEKLQKDAPKNLKWKVDYLASEGHVPPSSLSNGLNTIFSKLR